MRCWNCGREIPERAQACEFCEAAVEPEPTEAEKDVVRELLDGMPPDALDELRALMEQSETAEEFADRIFIGDCPTCGSYETGNCENDPEIDCLLVGRCYQCGQLWCSECGRLLHPARPACECWMEEE